MHVTAQSWRLQIKGLLKQHRLLTCYSLFPEDALGNRNNMAVFAHTSSLCRLRAAEPRPAATATCSAPACFRCSPLIKWLSVGLAGDARFPFSDLYCMWQCKKENEWQNKAFKVRHKDWNCTHKDQYFKISLNTQKTPKSIFPTSNNIRCETTNKTTKTLP